LLQSTMVGHLDERVRDRIVGETRGNPLGLLELPKMMSRAELTGGFSTSSTINFSGLEDHYIRRIEGLPEPTQRLLLVAAADPTGDAALVWRAAYTLGIGREAALRAKSEQLLEIGSRVRFRHPLVRAAAYVAGSAADRRAVHAALGAATDPQVDPERRTWHLASAAAGSDEDLAVELEQMAGRAQARAGPAAAAALLQRSLELTAAPALHVDRALAAAYAHMNAGDFDAARGLLAEGAGQAVDDLQRARVEQLRGQIEWASNPGPDAPFLLLAAAKRLEPLDVGLARETYLDAWYAAVFAGRLARPGGNLLEVSKAARIAPQPPNPRPCDLILDGLATCITDGRRTAEPYLRRALSAVLEGFSPEEWFRWGVTVSLTAMALWDFDSWTTVSTRMVDLARASGALGPLALSLRTYGFMTACAGDFERVSALVAEEAALEEATGVRLASFGGLLLVAYQGQPAAAASRFSTTGSDSLARGHGVATSWVSWTRAILCNGLGQYSEALEAAEQATASDLDGPFTTVWALSELIEAAVRSGHAERASDAMSRLSASTVSGSDWAAGIEARSQALLGDGQDAEHCYQEAVARLGQTRLRPDLARAHLLYGEWLRRENRRLDARVPLRAAFDLFAAMGAEAFGERARKELVATGEKVRRQPAAAGHDLTPQETHIARLARDGYMNAEIAAELFLSARTVEWHIRKVFAKLGIASRRELKDALTSPSRRMSCS
jgi:DNA-binding CsgD family transcriptional regulator